MSKPNIESQSSTEAEGAGKISYETLAGPSDAVRLTPVRSSDPFLKYVYEAVRREEVAAWGWDENAARSFIQMQYNMQQRSYEMQYPESVLYVIWVEHIQAGKLHVTDRTESLTLVDIALLPQFQRQGIGTKLVLGLQQIAKQAGKPIRLTAAARSPAERLYARLGFEVVEGNEVQVRMEWNGMECCRSLNDNRGDVTIGTVCWGNSDVRGQLRTAGLAALRWINSTDQQ
ncbi:hypothetical protein PCCS19_58660 [Paenibacillus sp. CCS19]|uniref:GNAT family N-acetyltransferase n=1 Tax=Paenibacillus sp. CCS19 TaxID=3158387 RepID=UPI00256159DA|nr:GNAT family N-acetyltransferase [Paenibacillus cellulosilyticus]GMK42806.1 hypothetical protein PCCS19_58660 [Paenibacillus cellulosilyticus]